MNTSEDNQSLPDNEKAKEVTRAFEAFLTEPLQKVSSKIDGLEAELENRDDRIIHWKNGLRCWKQNLMKLARI